MTAWLETADRIGASLCRDAVWHEGGCTWLGWSTEPGGRAYRAFATDLYSGTSGIALFLARLYQHTGDALEKATLEGAVNQSLSHAPPASEEDIGLYSGLTGRGWAWIQIGSILEHDRLVRRGLETLRRVGEAPLKARALDVVSGSAGVIPVLLAMGRRDGCGDLLAFAVLHGDHLLRQAERSPQGWSWNTIGVPCRRNLLGYSHGTAGIALALLKLHQATGERRFLDAALNGLRYERCHFDPEKGNWPDFRMLDPAASSPGFSVAWCHGAAGIGMARLRTAGLLKDDPEVAGEIEQAVSTTESSIRHALSAAGSQNRGAGQYNFSLCHGLAGNSELMLLASQQLERPELRAVAEAAAQIGVRRHHHEGRPWPCGLEQERETPGLMLGKAGIGYFYLRLHDDTTPSVLLI